MARDVTILRLLRNVSRDAGPQASQGSIMHSMTEKNTKALGKSPEQVAGASTEPQPKDVRIKKYAVSLLRHIPPLYIGASKLYQTIFRGFQPGNPGAPEALYFAFEAVKSAGIDGDYYEFGLFRGYTLWAAQDACRRLGLEGPRFWGFDSFRGMPAITGIDAANKEFYQGQWACSKQQVTRNLTEHGFDWSRAELIEGFYDDVLNEALRGQYPFRKASVAFLDCDLYTSTRDVLSWLAPFLDEGTLLLLDDWYTYADDPKLGQQKALGEFLEDHPELSAEDLGPFPVKGRWFRMHRTLLSTGPAQDRATVA